MTIHDINDIIKAVCSNSEDYEKPYISPKYLRQELEQLALEQEQRMLEPTTKNDLVVDCISRKAVNRIINKWLSHPDYELKDHIYSMTKKINSLPSVTPQEPVIDKIRAEIDELDVFRFSSGERTYKDERIDKDEVLDILDKYKAERKDKE